MSTWWSGHKVLDPTEIESRYAIEDGMAFMDALVQEELNEEGVVKLDRVRAVMDQLPPREADFIDLYYFKRVKQTDIATIFNVSQPTVCYRLQRAAARIQYILMLPDVDPDELEADIAAVISDSVDVKIMRLMHETTCQSEVAKQLGVSQGFVRHRFMRSIAKLRKEADLSVYVRLFEMISSNLNILREVQRPNWNDKVLNVLL